MKVVYAPRALRDISGILEYIHTRSPSGARNVSLAIEHSIHACASTPRAGGRTDETNVFRRPLGKYRYTIFYRIRSDGIDVIRVVHSARIRRLSAVPD